MGNVLSDALINLLKRFAARIFGGENNDVSRARRSLTHEWALGDIA
jgi:hypothetical protein